MMSQLYDAEFGEVAIKTVSHARHIRLRVTPNGTLSATIPHSSALQSLQRLINDSREELRPIIDKIKATQPDVYHSGQRIGSVHVLDIQPVSSLKVTSRIKGQTITVSHPSTVSSDSEKVQQEIKRIVGKALKLQASSYLPRRLAQLAEDNGFSYSEVKFGNAKGRWGSCSSNKLIRLNIALMKLPLGLIDYVLVHELAHTEELNHSSRFWAIVENAYPHYKSARKQLKNFTPYI